ncbi:hypothetical protein ACS49_04415 [Bacillus cereus]|nr:hypothetical protein ACS49_04415 [Bacillus cereus]
MHERLEQFFVVGKIQILEVRELGKCVKHSNSVLVVAEIAAVERKESQRGPEVLLFCVLNERTQLGRQVIVAQVHSNNVRALLHPVYHNLDVAQTEIVESKTDLHGVFESQLQKVSEHGQIIDFATTQNHLVNSTTYHQCCGQQRPIHIRTILNIACHPVSGVCWFTKLLEVEVKGWTLCEV